MQKAVLLIDAENFSYKHVQKLFEELKEKNFELSLKLAFADWTQDNLNNYEWKQTLNKLSIRPQHLFTYSNGKNASDIQLVIYAMDILYSQPDVDYFIIATSDGDFTPLVLKLKEHGKKVIGFGNAVSSQVLSDSCDEYKMIHLKKETEEGKEITDIKPIEAKKLRNILLEIWKQCFHDQEGWVHFDYIHKVSKKIFPKFNYKDYNYSSIKEMIEDCDLFEMLKVDNKNHFDHYFKPREKLSETLISSFDEIYFLNFSDYFDKNWLNISYLEDSAINISEHEYKNFADALNISYLYEIREIEDDNGNKQTYFRRRMTKDQRHILLLFIQAWHGYRKEHKIKSKTGDNSYIPLRELNKFIKDNFEKDFSAKKHGFSSMIKALKATFPLEVIEKEDYLIRPKYF
tara:strand:- start:12814 stop:14019 length:1206 start_codon:yes stop_codon:yes gene_type:complete